MNSLDHHQEAAKAVQDGNLEKLKDILANAPDVKSARDKEGRDLLDLACRAATENIAIPLEPGKPEHHRAVDLILQAGADPNSSDPDGWTPLHSAGMAGHPDLSQRLIAAGADVSTSAHGIDGATPLAYALFYAKSYMGEALSPTHPDNLRSAAALGKDLDRFVDGDKLTTDAFLGLDFYAPTFFPKWNRTFTQQEVLDEALSWAARNDQCGSMARLVELGANVNANPFRGTPLLWTCYSDRVEAATWLLDHGADPDLKHDFGGDGHGVGAVAMHLSAQFGGMKCLKLLLDRGADPTIVDDANNSSPAGWARYVGSEDVAKFIETYTR